jgi:tetratricopeptide (TPR) repeat protein
MELEGGASVEQHQKQWRAQVQKGQAFLEKGDVNGAIEVLEQAHQAGADNATVKTLLATAYLKGGQWSESASLYSELAALDEEDVMVRLNAAVCYVQLGEHAQARPHLEDVVSLQPELIKARSLLGTVYSVLGWFEEAREQFQATGQTELVAQMEAKLEERERAAREAEEAAERAAREAELAAEQAAREAEEAAEQAAREAELAAKAAEEAQEEPLMLLTQGSSSDDMPLSVSLHTEESNLDVSADFSAALAELSSEGDEAADVSLSELQLDPLEFGGLDLGDDDDFSPFEPMHAGVSVSNEREGSHPVIVLPSDAGGPLPVRRASGGSEEDVLPFTLTPPQSDRGEHAGGEPVNIGGPLPLWVDIPELFESEEQVFALLEDGRLFMQIQECGYVRINDLMLLVGAPGVQWESKRFQGKPIDQLFGPRDNPIARIDGKSYLLLGASEDKQRTSVLLSGSDVAYFREGAVLAFGNGIQWENGRVPSALTGISDLPLDNFWGEGELILESEGAIWGVPVKRDKRVRVEYQRLIGWVGSLVPQIIADESLSPSLKMRAFVEFEGEGGILISS